MNKSVSTRFSRTSVRLAAVALGALVAVPLFGQGVANADTTVRLPSQTAVKKLADRTTVTVTRTRESARISPSMGGTPLHRNAMVSGRYSLKASDPKTKMGIAAGYIVGCQTTFGAKSGTSATGSPSLDSTGGVAISGTAQTGGSVTIGPGQAKLHFINDAEYVDPFGSRGHDPAVRFMGAGSNSYTNVTMMINGCAGYAQARSVAKVVVITDKVTQNIWMYGKPFSLG